VKASNGDVHDSFGSGLAVSDTVLAVGAAAEDSAAVGVNGDGADNSADASGAVYLYSWPRAPSPTNRRQRAHVN
jgi:hypothetical protein